MLVVTSPPLPAVVSGVAVVAESLQAEDLGAVEADLHACDSGLCRQAATPSWPPTGDCAVPPEPKEVSMLPFVL